MEEKNNLICAGIVLYNPDITRLIENINSIIKQVDNIILIDNGSKNINSVRKKIQKYKDVILFCNNNNLGIATALNQLAQEAKKQGYYWILTLDQDSVCQPYLIEEYRKYILLPYIGMITCNIIDRNFGIESKTSECNYEECKFCITSGALMNLNVWEKIGKFDDLMFIDKVDYDICLSIREHGFKIIRVNYDGLLHEIGHAKKINILGRKCLFFNHSPFRRYYIAKNAIYCAKKHKSLNIIKEFLIAVLDILLVFLFEKNKISKFKASVCGLRDGFILKVKK